MLAETITNAWIRKNFGQKKLRLALEKIIGINDKYVAENKPKEFFSTVFIVSHKFGLKQNKHFAYQVAFPEGRKREIMFTIGEHFKEQNPKEYPLAVFLTSEAWRSKQAVEDEMIQPSQAADKEEVVIVHGVTMDKRSVMSMSKMKRSRGKIVALTDTEINKSDEYAGDSLTAEFYRGFTAKLIG